ncbi:MAG: 2-oxo acid dehydrogenase subunit E2 [Thermoanaerobaculia bacterium]|nr:2-oxo acid dehydrogenase subunit E2 [Thermoanaerobaculia bacterium]
MAELLPITVPDIGNFDQVDVLEVLVTPGATVAADDSILTLESDKATMDVPTPVAGIVREVKVKSGDKVKAGDLIALVEGEAADLTPSVPLSPPGTSPPGPLSPPPSNPPPGEGAAPTQEGRPLGAAPTAAGSPGISTSPLTASRPTSVSADSAMTPSFSPSPGGGFEGGEARGPGGEAYATPVIRRYARELGVDLSRVTGTGRKGRIQREDVQAFVKAALERPAAAPGGGFSLPAGPPPIDFSQFGDIETRPLTKIQRLTGQNLHRSWVTIPHVTQFEDADITELEVFRKAEGEARNVKLTLIPFLLKAVVAALREYPNFNASLAPDGENLILKKYFHVGLAVDTPQGLVVPVIKHVDRKGILELAADVADVAARARERKLKPDELQGGCFTISSLGGVGGTAFTPIVNPPEVAILGVSRADWKPVWQGGQFVPRQMLPLSLSYDHRVIDGVAGARFTTFLAKTLADVRRLLL